MSYVIAIVFSHFGQVAYNFSYKRFDVVNDSCIEVRLTLTFHLVNITWSFMIHFYNKICITYAYMVWSFVISLQVRGFEPFTYILRIQVLNHCNHFSTNDKFFYHLVMKISSYHTYVA